METRKNIANNTITRDLSELAAPTGNIYESVMIIAKRANQISADIKQELSKRLEEFSSYTDTLEEITENHEQIEISQYYEKLPKPTLVATEEFREGKIFYRKAE
ncbi:MAG: DNA-directed RNA polymerase subunit omega [Bacteroidales bacterium]|jgi:DNA-directed RNA polymerase subunit K/omega|nr:DNA-directed RNA polymerase subunit omega [Bacteroidales bacterium]